ncbi:MAG: hypothetical protein WC998_09295 [Candidatus Paceibacterota bacterium]|jgi:predicted HicB family RNase H-like nuclease
MVDKQMGRPPVFAADRVHVDLRIPLELRELARQRAATEGTSLGTWIGDLVSVTLTGEPMPRAQK